MNVVLIRPNSKTFIITPPVGLGYLATSLRKEGHEVEIVDASKDRLNCSELESKVAKLKLDIVGIQTYSCDVFIVAKYLDIIKNISRSITTVIGGAHPSGAPEMAMSQLKNADYAIMGEGEIGLAKLANFLEGNKVDLNSIPGLAWRENDKIKTNPRLFLDNLDSFGFPAWDLIDPRSYPKAPHQGFAKAFPIAPIVATRGCPYGCSFCGTKTLTGRKIRKRSIEHVLGEIALLVEKYGVREIHIEDDNFTFYPEYVMDFCEQVGRSDLKFYWHCSSGLRIDSLTEEMLRAMIKAGCYNFTVAIESGSQRILNHMCKRLSVETVREKVKLINKVGFMPVALFMLGYPEEKREDVFKTIKLALELKLKRAQFAIFHPLPGSPIFAELERKGYLKNLDLTKIRPTDVAFDHPYLKKEEIKNLQRYAILRFHLRPRIILESLKDMHNINNSIFILRRVFTYLVSS